MALRQEESCLDLILKFGCAMVIWSIVFQVVGVIGLLIWWLMK